MKVLWDNDEWEGLVCRPADRTQATLDAAGLLCTAKTVGQVPGKLR